MNTAEQSVDSLRQRQAVIEALWTEVDAYIIECYYPDLPVHVMQKTVHDGLKTLRGSEGRHEKHPIRR